ncbi:hypothetical protein BT96DRAFT_837371, partial [Gymnopus androsaceus JB14]
LSKDELDRCIHCLPPCYGVHHFKNGISSLSQMSGVERKNMGRILLACLVGCDTMPKRALTAVRAILDFIYLSQYTIHDDDTLSYMDNALKTWHKYKDSFIQTGVHKDLNIPKFHLLQHYVEAIRFLGATDNYNTEMFERLHIDFAKKGWQASNKRDEFHHMTLVAFPNRKTSIHLTVNLLGFWNNKLSSKLLLILKCSSPTQLEMMSFMHLCKQLPFQQLDIYHSFKFSHELLEEGNLEQKDVVEASPLNEGRFDTVVVLTADTAETVGLEGILLYFELRVGRVKVLFCLPTQLKLIGTHTTPAPSYWPKAPLAYIEWFTVPTLTAQQQKQHNMSTVQQSALQADGFHPWSIIPLTNICQSCMLSPNFASTATHNQASWTSYNILDSATSFFINNWVSVYTYKTIYKE